MKRTKKRSYDSAQRRQQAQLTQDAVLDESRRLFLQRGYAETTIAEIAKAAGVSVETIYKNFGGKPGLVRSIVQRGLAGAGPVHAETRSDAMQAAEADPRAIIRGWSRLAMEVSPRVSPILLLVRDAAAHDAEMAELQRELDATRHARMHKNAGTLVAGGHLRRGVSHARASDVLWLYTAPELYELLVLRRGWSVREYAGHFADSVICALL